MLHGRGNDHFGINLHRPLPTRGTPILFVVYDDAVVKGENSFSENRLVITKPVGDQPRVPHYHTADTP
jgi:hypothetical protein